MRLDLKTLLSHILFANTIERFGEPSSNRSMVVCICHDCDAVVELTVMTLKRHIKKRGIFVCQQCVLKRIWTNERREQKRQIQIEKWNDPEYRQHHERILEKQRTDPEYVEKHKEGCKKAYSDERKRWLSEQSKRLWKDPKFKRRQHESKKKMWENPEYRAKQEILKKDLEYVKQQSDKQKQVVSDPKIRRKISTEQKEIWKNPEYRENQSRKQKAVWERHGYRESQSCKQKAVWENPEYRAKYEKMWMDSEYRAKLSELIRQKWNEDSFRRRSSAAAKARWQDDEYREKIRSKLILRWKNPDFRKFKSEQSKKMWEDPSYKEQMGKIRAEQSGRKSSIEAITESILTELEVEFVFQSSVGPYVFDFFLPKECAYIECQGEYWHSLPGRQGRDAAKLSYLEKSCPGAKVLYLQERDFMNPIHVSAKIREFMFGEITEIKKVDFKFCDISIFPIDRNVASQFFNSFHYAGYGRGPKKVYGAVLNDKLVAACKIAPIIRSEVATSMSFKTCQMLEVDRFCIHPSYHKKNFSSWFLSRVSRMVFDEFPDIECLVSFADLTHGHVGTIYKAANWVEVGKVKPDYHYVNSDGWVIHKKTLYNRAVKMGMKEKEYAELHEYVKIFGKEKTKFILHNS